MKIFKVTAVLALIGYGASAMAMEQNWRINTNNLNYKIVATGFKIRDIRNAVQQQNRTALTLDEINRLNNLKNTLTQLRIAYNTLLEQDLNLVPQQNYVLTNDAERTQSIQALPADSEARNKALAASGIEAAFRPVEALIRTLDPTFNLAAAATAAAEDQFAEEMFGDIKNAAKQ